MTLLLLLMTFSITELTSEVVTSASDSWVRSGDLGYLSEVGEVVWTHVHACIYISLSG